MTRAGTGRGSRREAPRRAEPPAVPSPRGPDSGKRPRGSLTREVIVTESLRLLDTRGVEGFSLPKLGQALGADPTAVYRHFASKDDLVLAIGHRLIIEAMAGLEPKPCWAETITELARRMRTAYRQHPAAASLSSQRLTPRTAEMRTIDVLIGAVLAAGFTGARAALVYRAIAYFGLASADSEATFLALDERLQEADRTAWTRAYLAVDRQKYPSVGQIRDDLANVRDDGIFEASLSIFIEGLRVMAPRPCCPAHSGQRDDG
jgi:AcrR family transcriptional regulator